MFKRNKFPFYKQHSEQDCGATCLRIICKYYGKTYSTERLKQKGNIDTSEQLNLNVLSNAAEKIGLRTLAARLKFDNLEKLPVPFIAHWNQKHFIVVYKIKRNKIYVSDPAYGLITYSDEEFKRGWVSLVDDHGIVLSLETTADFYEADTESGDKEKKIGFRYYANYFIKFKSFYLQLILATLVGNILQLMFPFLTQAMVDKGIINQDLGFINIIIIAQLVLTVSLTINGFLSSWFGLNVGTRMGLSIISDFIAKMMRLPLSFFDTKTSGDITQRLRDHDRIRSFISATTIDTFFSLLNLFVYGIFMAIYSIPILLVFLAGTLLHMGWVLLFLKPRRDLDYKNFHVHAENETAMMDLINGVNEIKLNNIELDKRWSWERIQVKIFHLNIKSLALDQYQGAGSMLINQLKNVFISYLTAKSVVTGEITFGTMVSIQFIIGQLNAPFSHFTGLIQSGQDAKIALERLGEVQNRPDEDHNIDGMMAVMPSKVDIQIKNVSYQYQGSVEKTLKNINLSIPAGSTLAIVGKSGSGKTTLIKLLLKYYAPTEGEIKVDGIDLQFIPSGKWRRKCGIVMQDGFLFSDTIARNIAIGDQVIDTTKLKESVEVANIKERIETLPLAYNTKVGKTGRGFSQGQKQRLLIARAVYKEPDLLIFDEATSNLDSENELVILKNLEKYITKRGTTMIVVAHRLSTVKNADHIIVMDEGEIVEEGNHTSLVKKGGTYYTLIKNQLELGE